MTDRENSSLPPRLALHFLRWFCDPEILEDVEGDLFELHSSHERDPVKNARWQFIKEVMLLFRPGIIRQFKFVVMNRMMLRNYFLVAFRNARKYKGHTALNLLSLIVGIAACLTIILWLQDEVQKDKFHAKDERLYRVWRNMHQAGGEIATTAAVPQPVVVSLQNDYPEVDQAALVGWDMQMLFRYDGKTFFETGKYVSPEFFEVFSFPLLVGDPATSLQDLSSILISEQLAIKYFGVDWRSDGQLLGKTISIGDNLRDFTIAGVFADPGSKSSMQFDWLINAREYIQRNDWVESWYNGGFSICFTAKPGADIAALQDKILQLVNENTNYDADERLFINEFSDNYLYGSFENGRPVSGRIEYVRILAVIGVFILVIACINFMNLATAQSSRRSREVGVRKVLGAQKSSLRWQFYTEALLSSLVAVGLALVVVQLLLPYFNSMTGKELAIQLGDRSLWVGVGVVALVTTLLSGSYPALFMPAIEVTSSLKGAPRTALGGAGLRRGLVVFQFTLSVLLIIGTMVVQRQINFILSKNLGLNKDNVVMVRVPRSMNARLELYKNELMSLPEVVAVSSASGNPLDYGRSSGSATWAGKDPDEEIEINVMSVDEDFVETMGMEILAGRNFSADLATDTANYLINEVTAGIIGFNDPVGQDLTLWGLKGKIVGVVKDFHMSSMYEPIAPLIIRNDQSSTFIEFIRTRGNVQDALGDIKAVTAEFNPDRPFDYRFLDQEFAQTYQGEMTLSSVTRTFALISIIISCLGLFGLSSFSAEQRSKEIGIRKVYGASATRIVTMLSWSYTKLIVVAFLLAIPIAIVVMNRWLQNFEFHAKLSIGMFVAAAVATLLIGALTVAVKSWQAATLSPVYSIQEE